MNPQVTVTRRKTLLGATTLAAASALGSESPIRVAPPPANAQTASPEFLGGFPTSETMERVYDEADLNRAIQTTSALNGRPSLIGTRSTTVYHPGIVALDTYDTPNVLNNDYSIEGEVTVGADGGNGVIVANGGRFGGYSLWVNHGVPAFSYNLVNTETYRWKGTETLTPGPHQLRFSFVYDGGGFGKGGLGTLSVDGRPVDSHRVPSTICCTLVWFEGLDIGADNSTPVDEQYTVPNKFTGTIAQVVFNTTPMKLTKQQKTEFLQRLDAAARGIQ